MSDRVPKSSVVPPGGWHFVDRSTGVDHRIDGDNFQDVASRVLKFRIDNNRDPGNPTQEVSDFICDTWPHFCTSTPAPLPSASVLPFSHRVSAWIGNFFTSSKNDPGVSQDEATRRAAICASCPMNADYTKGGCGPCIEGIRRLSFLWLRNRKTPHDAKLGACKIFFHPNSVAVQAANIPAGPVVLSDPPENCWRK